MINAGRTLASDIQSAVSQVAALQTQVQSDAATNVTSLNSDLQQLAQLNSQIQQANTSGQQSVNLQDQRDLLVNQISAFTNVSTQQRPNGQIALYTPSASYWSTAVKPSSSAITASPIPSPIPTVRT